MTSPTKLRRPVLPGVLVIGSLVSALSLGLASTPAQAQIDNGTMPVVGTWTRGAHDTVAWVDLTHWKLVTSVTGAPFTVRFDPVPDPWFPVAGDWDGDGVDTVHMFHRSTWRVVPLENGPVEVTADPSPTPWVPVAGDWDGDGVDTIAVYDRRDDALHRLEEGPSRTDGYEPDPQPWLPVAGDWDGDRIDTLATVRQDRSAVPSSEWAMLSGDWDGDGIDTDAAFHLPTGELVLPEKEALAPRSTQDSGLAAIFAPNLGGGPGGCYNTESNRSQWVKVLKYGVGGCLVIVNTTWIEWTCCPASENGWDFACGSKLKMSVQTYGYSSC